MQLISYGLIVFELVLWVLFTYWFFGWFVEFFEELCGWGHPLAVFSRLFGFVLVLGLAGLVSQVVSVFYEYASMPYILIRLAFPAVSLLTMILWLRRKGAKQ